MSVFDSIPTTPVVVRAGDPLLDEAQLAAAAFLARYGGRPLESYRADLRQFFQWTARVGLAPVAATRAHIELYRAWMEDRGLAASTVDRRLSTLCGYYRFAHLDGRIRANPALHVRRPPVHPSAQRGMDRGELAAFLYAAERISPAHAALAVILVRHDGARLDTRTAYRWAVQPADTPGSTTSTRTCSAPRSSWPPSTPACRSATCSWPPDTPTHAPPPSTTGAARTSTGTPPTPSSRSLRAADKQPGATTEHRTPRAPLGAGAQAEPTSVNSAAARTGAPAHSSERRVESARESKRLSSGRLTEALSGAPIAVPASEGAWVEMGEAEARISGPAIAPERRPLSRF
jgi:hypothetical protein